MSQPIRVALVGYGYWGPNYARIFSELPGCEVAAICEVAPDRRQRATQKHPLIAAPRDLTELLRRPDIDAVVISTPASTHYEVALAAVRSGRHVLIEKPLALRLAHCDELAGLAERSGRVLMVAHTFLYNAGVRKMKEWINTPEFGRVYYLHATRTNLGPIRNDVNAVWDLAPHDVSIFNYLLGREPLWASAIGSSVLNNAREDVAFVTLGYADGVIGNIHVSWADPNKVRKVVAVGSGRRVVFDDLDTVEHVRVYEKGVAVGESSADSFGEFRLLVRDGDIISPHVEPSEPLKNQCTEFLAAIRTGDRPISDARFGASVVRTLLAIDASMRDHGAAREVSA